VAGGYGTVFICPQCGAKGGLRPDIVWFGEMPYYMDVIEKALHQLAHLAKFILLLVLFFSHSAMVLELLKSILFVVRMIGLFLMRPFQGRQP